MSTSINLKEIERKAWRSFFDDGLIEMALGSILLGSATASLITNWGGGSVQRLIVFGIATLIALTIQVGGKRFITAPRLGRVKFSAERKRRQWRTKLIASGALLLTLILLFAVLTAKKYQLDWAAMVNPSVVPVSLTILVMVVFGFMGYSLEYSGFYLVGVLYAIAFFTSELTYTFGDGSFSYITLGIPAIILIGAGAIIFTRFLHNYPVPAQPNAS